MKGTATASRASRKRNAGVGEGARIHDGEIDRARRERLDPVDQFMFGIALEALECRAAPAQLPIQALLDGGERDVAVPAGLPAAEQVQVGPIDEQDSMHCPYYASNRGRSASI